MAKKGYSPVHFDIKRVQSGLLPFFLTFKSRLFDSSSNRGGRVALVIAEVSIGCSELCRDLGRDGGG